MGGLGIPNGKPRKSLVKQAYDTGDNPIETVGVQYDTGKGILWLDNYSLTNISQDVKNNSYRNFMEESILSKEKGKFYTTVLSSITMKVRTFLFFGVFLLGMLTAHSDGLGLRATLTLEIPFKPIGVMVLKRIKKEFRPCV